MFSSSSEEELSEHAETDRPKIEYGLMKYDEAFFNRNKPSRKEMKKINSRNNKSNSAKKFHFTDEELMRIKQIDDEQDAIQLKTNELGRAYDTLDCLKDKIILCQDIELANKLNSAFENKFSIKVTVNREQKLFTIVVENVPERLRVLECLISDYIRSLVKYSKVDSKSTETGFSITLALFERDYMLAKINIVRPPVITNQHFEYEHRVG